MQTRKLQLMFLGVAIGLGLVLPRPAAAQLLGTAWRALDRIPDPRLLPGEIAAERFSERRLQRDQVRLQDDLSRGDAASVNRDLRRLQHDEVRTEHLRWEIQRDSLHLHIGPDPFYAQRNGITPGLIAHPQYPGYGYLAADPTRLYALPQPTPAVAAAAAAVTPTPPPTPVLITIANAGPSGSGMDFAIDGVTYKVASGPPQQLAVTSASEVTFDRGGSLGNQRYSLSAGAYEFRPTDAGWALYKLPAPAADPR